MSMISSLGSSISDLFSGSSDNIGSDLGKIAQAGLQIAQPYIAPKNTTAQTALQQAEAVLAGEQATQTAAQNAAIVAANNAASVAAQASAFGGTSTKEILIIGGIGLAAVLLLIIISEKA